MKVYTVKVVGGSVVVFPFITVDGEELVNGKVEKVIRIGDNKFIPVRNIESDVVAACNVFRVRAFDSNEFPFGTDILIPEVTTTSEEVLLLIESKEYVDLKEVNTIEKGIDDRDIRRCLLIMYSGSEATVEGIKIQFLGGKLRISGKIIE